MHRLYRILLFPLYLYFVITRKKLFVVCLDPAVHGLRQDDLEDLSGLCPPETVVAKDFTVSHSPRDLVALRHGRRYVVIIGGLGYDPYLSLEQMVQHYQTLAKLPQNKHLPRMLKGSVLGEASITFSAKMTLGEDSSLRWEAVIEPGSYRYCDRRALADVGRQIRKKLGVDELKIKALDSPAYFYKYHDGG